MKIFALLVFAFLVAPLSTLAQLPAGALDPDCYFPDENNPNEIVFRTGTPGKKFGLEEISNAGVLNGQGYQMPFAWSWDKQTDKSVVFFIDGEPEFDLLHPIARYKNVLLDSWGNPPTEIHAINFSRADQKDILTEKDFDWYIYWADENGNIDSIRKSKLTFSRYGNYGSTGLTNVFIGHFSSSSVVDIIALSTARWKPDSNGVFNGDTAWAFRYQGGERERDTIGGLREDSILFVARQLGGAQEEDYYRFSITMDINGDGVEDFLCQNYRNSLFLVDSKKGIDLARYTHSIAFDTLFSPEDEGLTNLGFWNGFFNTASSYTAGRILHKELGDSSSDFMGLLSSSTGGWGEYDGKSLIFRGGDQFGTRRLRLSDAELKISPMGGGLYGPFAPRLCGDLTGTGVPVLHMKSGVWFGHDYHLFYTMGKAADDKVDCFYDAGNVSDQSAFTVDSITANGDRFGDVLVSDAWQPENGGDYGGKVSLIKGTSKIPAKPNPKYSVVTQPLPPDLIQFDPQAQALVWHNAGEAATLEVYDLLGRTVLEHRFESATASERVSLSQFPSGSYIARASTSRGTKVLRISLIH